MRCICVEGEAGTRRVIHTGGAVELFMCRVWVLEGGYMDGSPAVTFTAKAKDGSEYIAKDTHNENRVRLYV